MWGDLAKCISLHQNVCIGHQESNRLTSMIGKFNILKVIKTTQQTTIKGKNVDYCLANLVGLYVKSFTSVQLRNQKLYSMTVILGCSLSATYCDVYLLFLSLKTKYPCRYQLSHCLHELYHWSI